ncbi:hypothetical protein BN1048_00059 [Jeotgalicoccus saudimassiliensis]|uniref:DUF402 domain-containing protein n=1 Tax=Jeotgalicoccus saudimassiliensis TaxID=1461582 RepID=A0A078LY47_9STAP|nr:DUF402 domain-containing protein [Jeotgalicoccus saudimassiliensis]CDZ98940.1 hypothetical protein BN1048_00059 [Jeotgalicoccus saudimassiliensis]
MKTKYLDKKKWRRLVRSKYDEIIITINGERFLAGMIHMHKVREPLSVPVVGEDTLVVANNFKWMQLLPEKRNYSITVMYDERWQEIQYYFDINYSHTLELGKARRQDLYLDVLVLPDGRYELVDEEDIKRAFKKGVINAKEKEFAYQTARELMDEIDKDFNQFKTLAAACLKELKKLM